MEFWLKIKTWFLKNLDAMSEGSIASTMWVEGYSDFEIEEVLRVRKFNCEVEQSE